MSELTASPSLLPDFNAPAAVSHRRWRSIKDKAARHLMALGGISVLIAIILIAFYLLYVVLPMFRPARIELLSSYQLPGNSQEHSVYYAMEEQHEIGLRLTDQGNLFFFQNPRRITDQNSKSVCRSTRDSDSVCCRRPDPGVTGCRH